jgi:hypothetical protein
MVSLETVAVLALIIVFICLFLLAIVSGRKRREGLEKASLEMGFIYTPKVTIELPDLELFEKRSTKKRICSQQHEVASRGQYLITNSPQGGAFKRRLL